ncbi:hypothetical protein KKH26_00985, partial [Patescibacteria group bacterium]|nr:hypothetical protein [Patescibacteria group bacterium]
MFLEKINENKVDDEDVSKAGLSGQRLKELVAREKAVRYLVESSPNIEGLVFSGFSRGDLTYARFFTIAELGQRTNQKVELLNKVKENFDSQGNIEPALQELATKYNFRWRRVFSFDERSGGIDIEKLKGRKFEKAKEELEVLINEEEERKKAFLSTLERSKTQIDPGVLIVSKEPVSSEKRTKIQGKKAGGFYHPPENFRSKSELHRVGIMVFPPAISPDVFPHEYAHFEDETFYAKERERSYKIIGEINTYMSGVLDRAEKKSIPIEKLNDSINVIRFRLRWSYVPRFFASERSSDRENYNKAKEDVDNATKVIFGLYKKGISADAINSILMNAKNFKDILQWENISNEDIKEMKRKGTEIIEDNDAPAIVA